ncbi:MAG TPA: phosphotransferase [Acidimicrobiales bacterium]|nr:phosphotransferase [Acidimicrobiales bacterium]
MTSSAELTAALEAMLPGYLPRQRWYSGSDDLGDDGARVVQTKELASTGDGSRHLHQVLVEAGGGRYQLLVGERPAGEPAEFLHGHEGAVLGALEHSYLYDATLDPELARALLPVVTGGSETASRVRPVSAEQSNTSLVYDDRVILKVFRRLHEGRNPDVEVTTALAGAGFAHVARPVGEWREDDTDLAFAQQFLAGGTEGWALALTSLRDFYDSGLADPAEAGGDFALEAGRLGRVTAELHVALAAAFGVQDDWADGWSALVDDVGRRLAAFGAEGGAGAPGGSSAEGALERLRSVADLGPAIRVHGDYHLGQVMRTDGGWYVLDFEGEPARPLEERVRSASPLKDVAGMLRSLDYAARFALIERGDAADDDPRAPAWVACNREAFLTGYRAAAEERLLPGGEAFDLVLAGYELDKALYELDYEKAYRPSWRPIPAAAITRIVERLIG